MLVVYIVPPSGVLMTFVLGMTTALMGMIVAWYVTSAFTKVVATNKRMQGLGVSSLQRQRLPRDLLMSCGNAKKH